MHDIERTPEQGWQTASALLHAFGDDQLGEAEIRLQRLQELNGLDDDHPDILLFRAMIAIQRGQVVDALRYVNGLPDDHCPEVKALCMFFAQDPLWQGLARDLAENSPQAHVRRSMALLLNVVPS
jgi:hypothetical protein